MMTSRRLPRREFLAATAGTGLCSQLAGAAAVRPPETRGSKPVRIRGVDSNFERERLKRPLGFKGGYMTEKWQIATRLESESGRLTLFTECLVVGSKSLRYVFGSCWERFDVCHVG
jgi:hypothetical protein